MRALVSLLSIGGMLLYCFGPLVADDEKEPEEGKGQGS